MSDQEQLFPEKVSGDEQPPKTVVVSNRFNVNEFCSRRIIVPKDSFLGTHFSDLFDYQPNAIPLFKTPVSSELLERATKSESDTNFPVLIEVTNHKEGSSPTVISFSDVIAFHFQSERDRDEFPRDYANVDPFLVDHLVSPQLFGLGTQKLTDLEKADKQSNTSGRALERLSYLDKWSGAVTGGAYALSQFHTDSHSLNLFLDLIGGKENSYPSLAYLDDFNALRNGNLPDRNDSSRYVEPASGQKVPDDEWILFSNIISDLVQNGLPDDAPTYIEELIAGHEKLAPMLIGLRSFLTSERALQPFLPPGQNILGRALLIALLRRDLSALFPWSKEKMFADSPTIMLAAMLIGASTGRTGIDLELRVSDLDDALAQHECDTLVGSESDSLTASQIQSTIVNYQKHEHVITFPDFSLTIHGPLSIPKLLGVLATESGGVNNLQHNDPDLIQLCIQTARSLNLGNLISIAFILPENHSVTDESFLEKNTNHTSFLPEHHPSSLKHDGLVLLIIDGNSEIVPLVETFDFPAFIEEIGDLPIAGPEAEDLRKALIHRLDMIRSALQDNEIWNEYNNPGPITF